MYVIRNLDPIFILASECISFERRNARHHVCERLLAICAQARRSRGGISLMETMGVFLGRPLSKIFPLICVPLFFRRVFDFLFGVAKKFVSRFFSTRTRSHGGAPLGIHRLISMFILRFPLFLDIVFAAIQLASALPS